VVDMLVPPFADFASADRFHRVLMLYLSRLDERPDDPVGFTGFLLGQTLWPHKPERRYGEPRWESESESWHRWARNHSDQPVKERRVCGACHTPYPCRTVLTVALASRFPAPWTPYSLVAAMRLTGLLPSAEGHSHGWVMLGEDSPRRIAERTKDGVWTVRAWEKNSEWVEHEAADDAAFCAYLMDQVDRFPYPYGNSVPEDWRALVEPAAEAARRWWTERRRAPYLAEERPR
jgi:hypothetical protein